MASAWRQALPAEHRRLLSDRPPAFHPPMLATLVQEVPPGDLAYERKLDGYRVVAVCGPGGARLYSRAGHDITHRFPLTDGLPARACVLDGEAVAFVDGRDSFSRVQRGQATNLVFFDIMQLDRTDVRALPWQARRPLMDGLRFRLACARLPWSKGDGEAMLETACAAGWEGLIAKRPDAPYVPGRSRAWLKLKCVRGQEFVIGGYTQPGGARTGLGALLVGYYDDGLQYAGKVGTGFDERTLKDLKARLAAIERPEPPFEDGPRVDANWVRPELVCQVDFTEWTEDGRLRHPRFLGLRDDKRPVEVVRET